MSHDARAGWMSTQTLEAFYQKGSFQLLQAPPLPLREGQRVQITISTEVSPDDVLLLVTTIFDGLSTEEIAAIQEIVLQRKCFFGERL
jgi:predicted DNA-binding antitoxin AbrB/MazE fold protein